MGIDFSFKFFLYLDYLVVIDGKRPPPGDD